MSAIQKFTYATYLQNSQFDASVNNLMNLPEKKENVNNPTIITENTIC